MGFEAASKKYARLVIVVLSTFITAGLYFVPLTVTVSAEYFEYLKTCLMGWLPINAMALGFYFKDEEA